MPDKISWEDSNLHIDDARRIEKVRALIDTAWTECSGGYEYGLSYEDYENRYLSDVEIVHNWWNALTLDEQRAYIQPQMDAISEEIKNLQDPKWIKRRIAALQGNLKYVRSVCHLDNRGDSC